jgi:hypothetical protein
MMGGTGLEPVTPRMYARAHSKTIDDNDCHVQGKRRDNRDQVGPCHASLGQPIWRDSGMPHLVAVSKEG